MTGVGRIVVALSLLAGLWPSSVAAQATKAGVVTILEGNVTARRVALPDPVPLKFKDPRDFFAESIINLAFRPSTSMRWQAGPLAACSPSTTWTYPRKSSGRCTSTQVC